MSAHIDVLAVLDECRAGLHSVASNCRTDLSTPMRERAEAMDAARAAVAELIERARALRSAHCAFQDWKAKAPKRYPAPRSILEMNAHAKAMLFAALDRVGGAK